MPSMYASEKNKFLVYGADCPGTSLFFNYCMLHKNVDASFNRIKYNQTLLK